MGKLVKYCGNCDESYAEKFSFCPICASELSTYQLNPIAEQSAKPENISERKNSEFEVREYNPQVVKSDEPAVVPVVYDAYTPNVTLRNGTANGVNAPENLNSEIKSFKTEPVSHVSPEVTAAYDDIYEESVPANVSEKTSAVIKNEEDLKDSASEITAQKISEQKSESVRDENQRVFSVSSAGAASQASAPQYIMHDHTAGYHVTFVEEKGQGMRRLLLLGSFLLVSLTTFGGLIYSLYANNAYVGAMDSTGTELASLIEEVPIEEEEPPKPKTDDDAGGGGGGGREEKTEASKGRLPPQSEKPQTTPNVNIPIMKNPSIPVIQETQGKIKRERTDERTGLPYSINTGLSNGQGSGGGIGSGVGTGVGRGRGTGEGSGIGSGSGSGVGTGIGRGIGDGVDGSGAPPALKPKVPPGPPVGFNIISKPKPAYTDAARVKQTSGVVRLRVVFNANGTVGSVSAISGLPDGLTEQAIAAARQIKFTPANRGGVPVAVTKTIEYTFNMY